MTLASSFYIHGDTGGLIVTVVVVLACLAFAGWVALREFGRGPGS